MANVIYYCSKGHEIQAPATKKITKCIVVSRGKPCEGVLSTKPPKEKK